MSCGFMMNPTDEIVLQVTEAVSKESGTPVEGLPILYDTIDVDALGALMADSPANDITVSFTYAGLHVIVHSDWTVDVRPLQNVRPGPRNEVRDINR